MDDMDQRVLDDLIRRVGMSPILEALADHVLFHSARLRRRRDQATNQEAKARYRLMGRKLESASGRLVELSRKIKSVEDIK